VGTVGREFRHAHCRSEFRAQPHGAAAACSKSFYAALREALDSDLPYVIALRLDPEAITPMETLTAVREGAAT
jgi:thiamine pyrophosphate-dependent acetolactate synthase large subunit-like protein